MTRYLSHTETNKLIRKALSEAFPGFKFSVRKSGGSTYVDWIDGPTAREAEAVAGSFAGATFDSMTDYRGHKEHTLKGERVSFGADFIFFTRTISEAHRAAALAAYDALDGQDQCDFLNANARFTLSCHTDAEQREAIARHWPLVKAAPSPLAASVEFAGAY